MTYDKKHYNLFNKEKITFIRIVLIRMFISLFITKSQIFTSVNKTNYKIIIFSHIYEYYKIYETFQNVNLNLYVKINKYSKKNCFIPNIGL